MKVLVTGAKGFLGQNICLALKNEKYEVFEFGKENNFQELRDFIQKSDWIIHLAGVLRPLSHEEFQDSNVNLTKRIMDLVLETGSKAPIIFSSSTQAAEANAYGLSKKQSEDQLLDFQIKYHHPVYIYRFYHIFGKWCRPNYTSVVATFCYNIAHDLPIQINEAAPAIDFVYIDDLISGILELLRSDGRGSQTILYPEPHYSITLHELANAIYDFKKIRENFMVPNISHPFYKALYSTYLTYYEPENLSYPLVSHIDNRGSFTEILKSQVSGQISVNVSKPHITKGNHYHMSKNEKYLVVSGVCEIKLRKINSEKIVIYRCSGDNLQIIDIPPGYVHNITNIGNIDSVTIMWANELYDSKKPDTFPMEVE